MNQESNSDLSEQSTSEPSVDEVSTDVDLSWEYVSDRETAIILEGYPDTYDVNYIVLVRLDPGDGVEELEDLVCLGTDDAEFIEEIELPPYAGDIKETLKDARIELQIDGSGVENQVVQDKFRKLFLREKFNSQLCRLLRRNQTEEAKEYFHKQVRDDLFPGSHIEQTIEIFRWKSGRTENNDQFNGKEEGALEKRAQQEGDSRSDLLSVSARVRPFLGTEIGALKPGDVFEVRVIGQSAQKLRPRFLDKKASEDQPFSKPLEARLVSMEQGDVPQEIRFLVELENNIYGIGQSARDARVLCNEQLVRSKAPAIFSTLRIVLYFCSLGLLSTLILLLFIL